MCWLGEAGYAVTQVYSENSSEYRLDIGDGRYQGINVNVLNFGGAEAPDYMVRFEIELDMDRT